MRYTGNTPVKAGEYVRLTIDDEVWLETKVVDALATQFTVKVNKGTRFFFYSDEGVTWQRTSAR